MKTLLQKAKGIKVRQKPRPEITDEHIELAIAWLKSEIGLTQMQKALGFSVISGSSLYKVAMYLREGYKRGIIKIK